MDQQTQANATQLATQVEPKIEPMVLGIRDSAIYMGRVSTDTVRRLVRSGELRTTRLGRRVLIFRSSLDELLERGAQ